MSKIKIGKPYIENLVNNMTTNQKEVFYVTRIAQINSDLVYDKVATITSSLLAAFVNYYSFFAAPNVDIMSVMIADGLFGFSVVLLLDKLSEQQEICQSLDELNNNENGRSK